MRTSTYLLLLLFLVTGRITTAQEKLKTSLIPENFYRMVNNPIPRTTVFSIHNYHVTELNQLPDTNMNILSLKFTQNIGDLVIRTSIPVITTPEINGESISGIGDINILAPYLFSDKKSDLQYGIGPAITLPTGKTDIGSKKWKGGVTGVFYNMKNPIFQYGLATVYQISFAGDDNASDRNDLQIQPYGYWQLGKGVFLRSAPAFTFDLKNGNYNIPLGMGIGKIVRVNNALYSFFIEPQYSILQQGIGQSKSQIFMGLNIPIIPKDLRKFIN